MKFSTVVAQRYYAQMNDTKKQILTEVNEADCCFGTAVKYVFIGLINQALNMIF